MHQGFVGNREQGLGGNRSDIRLGTGRWTSAQPRHGRAASSPPWNRAGDHHGPDASASTRTSPPHGKKGLHPYGPDRARRSTGVLDDLDGATRGRSCPGRHCAVRLADGASDSRRSPDTSTTSICLEYSTLTAGTGLILGSHIIADTEFRHTGGGVHTTPLEGDR